jgi:hypothetical protein
MILCQSRNEVSMLILILACTIDTSGRIDAKLGGVNALSRSHALEKLLSVLFVRSPLAVLETHRRLVPPHQVPMWDTLHPV